MKLLDTRKLIESITNVGEFESEKLQGVADAAFADSVNHSRKLNKEIEDRMDKFEKEASKDLDNTEKDRTDVKVKSTPELKKMHLSEDLFEDWEEDELKEDIESARPYHDDLLSAIEDGFVDYETVAKAALKFMSDDDIKELCKANDFNIEPAEDLNEADSDPHAMSMKEAVGKIIEKFGNNAHKYRLKAEGYERYSAGGIYSRTFKAPNDYIALFSMVLHGSPSLRNLEDYFEPSEILELLEEHPTFDALLDFAASVWWGDGDDYIISLTNLDTGNVLYEGDYEPEDEDDDSYDYNESLSESLDEDETSDIILEIYEDETSDFPYTDEYQADAHFAELEQMSDTDLNGRGIIGYARLMKNDEGNFFLADKRYACDDSQIQLIDTAIDEFLGNKLNEAKSDKPAAQSIEDAQKWVDYDMEKYGHISDETNDLVKKAGFQIIKDDHGDYEVTAGKFESIKEDLVIIGGIEDFKTTSDISTTILEKIKAADKLADLDKILEKMYPEGAKASDINDVLESEDGAWILRMLDIEDKEKEVDADLEVTDTAIEA